jgi:hypothetical protein
MVEGVSDTNLLHTHWCLWLNWIEYQTTDLRVESSSLSKHVVVPA